MTPIDLKSARSQLGLSQGELAGALQLGADGGRTIRRWEAGDRRIPGPVEVALRFMLKELPQRSPPTRG